MNGSTETTDAAFKEDVLESELPVLVDFHAVWCGPCKAVAPVLEEFAEEYEGRLKVVKANVDECPELATTYRIRAVPTLMLFSKGKAVETITGLPPLDTLRRKIDGVVGTASAPAPVRGCCSCSSCS